MRTIYAEYRVVTPLMLGGANHAPEFRLASYVNVLRWWWRFLALGRYDGCPKRATFWEAVLFGWSAAPFGRKKVSFRLLAEGKGYPEPWNGDAEQFKPPPDRGAQDGGRKVPAWLARWSGISYLTAQGFMERRPANVMAFAVEGLVSDFKKDKEGKTDWGKLFEPPKGGSDADRRKRGFLEERLRTADEDWRRSKETLVDPVALIGLLGGLGARSRRGFGSLAIDCLKVDGKVRIKGLPAHERAYLDLIKTHLGNRPQSVGDEPPYTAFGPNTAIDVCCLRDNARDLMNEVGWAFQIYRSWGQRDGRTGRYIHRLVHNGEQLPDIEAGPEKSYPTPDYWYERRFQADHDDFHGRGFPSGTFDNRSVFGLPHNYRDAKVAWDNPPHRRQRDERETERRRASPLMFHFHRLAEGATAFVAMVAPATFVPEGAQLRVSRGRPLRDDFPKAPASSGAPPGRVQVDWSLLTGFSGFVRSPFGGAARKDGRGIVHTDYTRSELSVP